MTIWNDNAARFSTRDRECSANLLLNKAVRESVSLIRLGFPADDAALVLRLAGERAERVLGGTR